MKLTLEKTVDFGGPDGETMVATLTVTRLDLMRANLNSFDQCVIRECEKAPTISSKLLALEIIARRIEESEDETKNRVRP